MTENSKDYKLPELENQQSSLPKTKPADGNTYDYSDPDELAKAFKESSDRSKKSDEALQAITQKCLEKMDQILELIDVMRKEREERQARLKAEEEKYGPFTPPKAGKNARRRTAQRRRRR